MMLMSPAISPTGFPAMWCFSFGTGSLNPANFHHLADRVATSRAHSSQLAKV